MKPIECPKCGGTVIGDRWCAGRQLQYYCRDMECDWKAKPRTPESIPITNEKELRVDNFQGWDYIMYDKYGHTAVLSRSYGSEEEATKELMDEMERFHKNAVNPGAPYTAVLFYTPPSVTIQGKMFKRVDNKTVPSA